MTISIPFNIESVHPSWLAIIEKAFQQMEPQYLGSLSKHHDWLPGPEAILNAFSLPLENTSTVLLGESPYPRRESANGYAFWDGRVDKIWAPKGLSTEVNRATSLRNFIKMLLISDGRLTQTSQDDIAQTNKADMIETLSELFENMIRKGFLLLNATLVLDKNVKDDAKAWRPFMKSVFADIALTRPECQCLLFGSIAKDFHPLIPDNMKTLVCEHPYNISFIHNPLVQAFFKPLQLLKQEIR